MRSLKSTWNQPNQREESDSISAEPDTTMDMLEEVKDIRSELYILESLAGHQKKLWDRLLHHLDQSTGHGKKES